MLKKTKLNRCLLAAFGGAAVLSSGLAFGQAQLERVEVTGSSIKRTNASEGALPVTILKADDLRQQGITSVEGIVQLLTASQSISGGSNSIGSGTGGAAFANLRGLGNSKTLILLNGRRLAAFAFGVDAV